MRSRPMFILLVAFRMIACNDKSLSPKEREEQDVIGDERAVVLEDSDEIEGQKLRQVWAALLPAGLARRWQP